VLALLFLLATRFRLRLNGEGSTIRVAKMGSIGSGHTVSVSGYQIMCLM
jgi:hypothetical protein